MYAGVRKLGSPISRRMTSSIVFARSKISLIAERRAEAARAATSRRDRGPSGFVALMLLSDVAVPVEAVEGTRAVPDFLADMLLGGDDLLGLEQHGLRVFPRDDEHSIELAEDDVARLDDDAADHNGLLRLDHLPAPDRVERRQIAVEDLESDGAEPFGVAQVAVEHAARATAGPRRVRRQLAEMPNVAVRVDRDQDGVGIEPLEDLEVGPDPHQPGIPADRGERAALDGERQAHHALLGEQWAAVRR